jgi:hypothetical protein
MGRTMNLSAVRCLSALGLGIALSVTTASVGWAQMAAGPGAGAGMGGAGMGGGSHRPTSPASEKPSEAPPDAVPGAKARQPAAPATRAASEMEPTEALFDAINRGDIASARDALSRGADLDGINVLGLTPMELSVDLGRNDISFLLLSMRGEDTGRGSRAAAHVEQDTASKAGASKAGASKAGASKAGASKRTHEVKARVAGKPVAVAVAEKPVATPKLFANDGGTPLPSAGFLGFGSGSATN